MIIFSLFSWWYTTGWLTFAQKCADRIKSTLAFFSVGQLLGSLFAPFRQISAGKVQGPLNVQLRAFGDRVFSRIMGAIVRLILIAIGIVLAAVMTVVCAAAVVAWPLLPFAPLIALIIPGKGL